jgi:hypothetical protein
MLNTYEVVHEIIPTKWGDKVELKLTFSRGYGYYFRAMPCFEDELGREYHLCNETLYSPVRMDFPCQRQSKKRYEDAKEAAFAYIYSDAGRSALNDWLGIVLLGKVSEREYDKFEGR